MFGAALSLVLLNEDLFAVNIGWRIAFGLGAILGPWHPAGPAQRAREPPLAVHPRPQRPGRGAGRRHRTAGRGGDRGAAGGGRGVDPDPPAQEHRLGVIAHTAFKRYPRRTILGLALFVGQAFLDNAVFFTQALVLCTFFGVADDVVPAYIIPFAFGNLLGPVLLGRLFDSVGRRPMITLCYMLSGCC